MRKVILLFFVAFVLGFQTPNIAQIWTNLGTVGTPNASFYLGDFMTTDIWFAINQSESGMTGHFGIGVSTNGTSWNWYSASYDNTSGSDRWWKYTADNVVQFTQTGNWYYSGRFTTPTVYYASQGWTENVTTLNASSYFTVNSLVDPSGYSAVRDATNPYSQINLSWTKWESRDVMIVRKTGGYSSDPPQGTAYSQGADCGGGTVVYKGSGTSFNDTGLDPGTTYYYTIYSENYSYYSSGVELSTISTTSVSTTLETTGSPVASFYLGDFMTTDILFVIDQDTQGKTVEFGIGTTQNGSGWTWRSATFHNYTDPNRTWKYTADDVVKFTSTGNWYYAGQFIMPAIYYADQGLTENRTTLNASSYFTVNALENPSGVSAVRDGVDPDHKVDISWTRWNSKYVMIVRKAGTYAGAPSNGTIYSVGQPIDGGTVIYFGDGISGTFEDAGLTPLTTYYYSVYSENNGYYSSGALTNVATLPVELTSFSAKQNGSNINLNWKTATEVNNYGFEVQKSNDNSTWSKIGFVQGAGNSNSPKEYFYTDKLSNLNGKFYYRLKQMDNDGTISFSKVVEVENVRPSTFDLRQNYPNPFNPSTVIKYQIPVDARVSIKVYNVLGNVVATLQNGFQTAGEYSVTVDGSNLASGVYFYKIEAGDFSATKKMLLTK